MYDEDRIESETNLPELAKWVREIAELTKPDDIVLVRRLAGRMGPADHHTRRGRDVHAAESRAAAE